MSVNCKGAAVMEVSPDGTTTLTLMFTGFPTPGYAASFAEVVQLLLEQHPPKLVDLGIPQGSVPLN